MKDYTLENISEWVTSLSEKSKFYLWRLYNMVLSNNKTLEKEKTIIANLNMEQALGGKYVHFVGEDLAVLEFHNHRDDVVYYIPYAEGRKNGVEFFKSFDDALLSAVSLKYTGDVTGGKFAARMLEVKEND